MRSSYKGHRFPPEVISYAVWLYHRFTLSFRNVEDLLAERGIIVSSAAEPSILGERSLVLSERQLNSGIFRFELVGHSTT